MFDPVSNQWTWRDGNNSTNTSGVYTGTAVPGAREGSVSWIDAYGQMWLFSGKGYDKFGALGDLNDLWKYDPNSYAWTHVKGQQTINAFGLVDQPGARRYAVPWIDANNNFYVFGGYGKGTTGTGYLNDLWKIFAGTTYIFIGNGSWFDASNWYNFFAPPSTLLTAGWNVIIDHQIPGDCILAGNLSIMGGGRVKIESQKQLTIDQGDLVNEGELVGVGNLPGKVIFTGVNNNGLISSGTISTPLILQDKKMFLTGNTSTVSINLLGSAGRLSTPDAVGSSLTLGEYNLYMDTASLFTNNSNYIITNGTGRLVRTVGTGSSVLFPIGIDQNSYTPATILNNGIADDFEVAVKTGVFTRADSGTAITSEHVNRSWFIQKGISANNNATITLQWNTGEEQVGFLRQQSYISHFNSCPPPDPCTIGYWDDAVLSSAVANGTSYMQLRNFTQPINSYPFFTVKSRIEYIFVNATGDGIWANVNNWMYQRKPPVDINDPTRTIIGPGMQVSIEQNCQFTGQLLTQPGGSIMIKEGKRLNIHQ